MPGRCSALIAVVALIAAAAIAGCGSSTPKADVHASASARRNRAPADSQARGVAYARCMRAHGVSNFPDPSAGGGFNVHTAGIDMSSPAARAARTACESLLPTKTVPYQAPTPAAYRRLVAWAQCMRRHGVAGMPDPKPNPPPGPGSGGSQLYRTIMGDGGYWVGIPDSVNAHSSSFMHLATDCGENPLGGHRR